MEEKLVLDFMLDNVPVETRHIFLSMIAQYKKTTKEKVINLYCSVNFLYVILTRANQLSRCKE